MTATRERLPAERRGITHKFVIRAKESHKGYVTVGLYPDGRLGEIFVKMDKQGSDVSGFIDAWAIAISLLLQTGTPLQVIVDKFKNMRFEPAGMTDTHAIRFAESPVSYICRWLEKRFLDAPTSERTDPDGSEAHDSEGSTRSSGDDGESSERDHGKDRDASPDQGDGAVVGRRDFDANASGGRRRNSNGGGGRKKRASSARKSSK